VNFKVKTKEEDLILTQEELFTQILAQAFKQYEEEALTEDHVSKINKLLNNLNENNLDVTMKQMYSIYFLCGYYYKIFLTKNNVELINNKDNQ
jgi:hypothetical protein